MLVNIRQCEGRPEACLEKAQELISNGSFSNNIGHRIDLFIKIGESYVELKDFKKAIHLGFLKAEELLDETMAEPTRHIYQALIQCFYELGDYYKALGCGEFAMRINRHFDGLYKYIALSHKAVGDLDKAIDTMSDAVAYEAPWNELGKAENKHLLEELKNEQQQQQQQQQQQEGK
jgi:tetratricopeptide (TPR) repeat protein